MLREGNALALFKKTVGLECLKIDCLPCQCGSVIEHQPMNQRSQSTLSQGACPGCGHHPQCGACGRQQVDDSLSR